MKRLLLNLMLIAAATLSAMAVVPEAGKVYRFESVLYPGEYLTSRGPNANPGCLPPTDFPEAQYWLAEPVQGNANLRLRNLRTGLYLFSPTTWYTLWSQTANSADNGTAFQIVQNDAGNFLIRRQWVDMNHLLHTGLDRSISSWFNDGSHSQWTIDLIDIDSEQIDAYLAAAAEMNNLSGRAMTMQEHLDALFADKACTRLSAQGELEENEHYLALPAELQRMVRKVQSGDWSEPEIDWDAEHALKYRVQLYEPYSNAGQAAGLTKVQAYSNMNNPTGVLAHDGQFLYVMVDSEVPAGATLYIEGFNDVSLHDGVTSGYPLHQGLNIIPCYNNNSHFFIYYTANTVANSLPTQYRLGDFPPIKIHIEGGELQGFFNSIGDELYTPDTRADYDYTITRAKHVMYDLLGRYMIFHVHKEDTPNSPGGNPCHGLRSALDPSIYSGDTYTTDPAIILDYMDRISFAERIFMGLMSDEDIADPYNQGLYSSLRGDDIADPGFDFADYFNNRMMCISMQSINGTMNATSSRIAMSLGSVAGSLNTIPNGNIWAIAHEHGHINQGPIYLNGTTEISNNIFSNVCLYYHPNGTTSRTEYPSTQLSLFNQNKSFLAHSTWGCTRMFWQLWMYYHGARNNTKFYPRLYELLRRNPLNKPTNCPKNDLLHFAKMASIAAQEDLTDFFTAWGFFAPLAGLTDADIAEFHAEMAELNLPKNDAIILIDDRPGNSRPDQAYYKKANAGTLGSMADFIAGVTPSGNVTYSLEGNTMQILGDGNPGLGFIIRDAEGRLLGFSNSRTFQVSDAAAEAINAGQAVIVCKGADNADMALMDVAEGGTDEQKRTILQELVASADLLLPGVDPEGIRPGMLWPESAAALQTVRDVAAALLAADDADPETFAEPIYGMRAALLEANAPEARIPFRQGATYTIVNSQYADKCLGHSDGATTIGNHAVEASLPITQQWVIESTGQSGHVYLRNAATGYYIGGVTANNQNYPMTLDAPADFTAVRMADNVWTFRQNSAQWESIHLSNGWNLVRWNSESQNSQWVITMVNDEDFLPSRQALQELTDQATQLLLQVADLYDADYSPVTLTEESFYSNAPHLGSGNDCFTSWSVLIDDNVNTYFHSNWAAGVNSDDGLDHYLRITIPEDQELGDFNFTYTSRNNAGGASNIKAYTLAASADGTLWTPLVSESGLTLGAAQSHTVSATAPLGTRYLRFMVHTTAANKVMNHACFALSSVSLESRPPLSATPNGHYEQVTDDMVNSLTSAITQASAAADKSTDALLTHQAATDRLTAACQAIEQCLIAPTSLNDEMGTTSALSNTPTLENSNTIYTLQGRRVDKPTTHGIYIINGRKVRL